MYKVMVSQYFDTYFEWKKQFKESVSTLELAEELKNKAHDRYHSRPLVSYSIEIEEV